MGRCFGGCCRGHFGGCCRGRLGRPGAFAFYCVHHFAGNYALNARLSERRSVLLIDYVRAVLCGAERYERLGADFGRLSGNGRGILVGIAVVLQVLLHFAYVQCALNALGQQQRAKRRSIGHRGLCGGGGYPGRLLSRLLGRSLGHFLGRLLGRSLGHFLGRLLGRHFGHCLGRLSGGLFYRLNVGQQIVYLLARAYADFQTCGGDCVIGILAHAERAVGQYGGGGIQRPRGVVHALWQHCHKCSIYIFLRIAGCQQYIGYFLRGHEPLCIARCGHGNYNKPLIRVQHAIGCDYGRNYDGFICGCFGGFGRRFGCRLGSRFCRRFGSRLGSRLFSRFGSRLFGRLGSRFGCRLGGRLFSRFGGRLGSRLGCRLGSRFGGRLFSRLGSRLGGRLFSRFGSRLGCRLFSRLGGRLGSRLNIRKQLCGYGIGVERHAHHGLGVLFVGHCHLIHHKGIGCVHIGCKRGLIEHDNSIDYALGQCERGIGDIALRLKCGCLFPDRLIGRLGGIGLFICSLVCLSIQRIVLKHDIALSSFGNGGEYG